MANSAIVTFFGVSENVNNEIATSNYIPRESKDQTLPIGSRESFIWIILKTILGLVLDFQGIGKKSLVTIFHRLAMVGCQIQESFFTGCLLAH